MFKRPESVLVVVHTAGGEVLQLRRREPAGFWQSVTGSLDPGESPLAAARRELREETGLAGDADLSDTGIINRYPIHPAWRHRYAPAVRENVEHVFTLALPERAHIDISHREHLEYVWLPYAEAAARAGSATDRAAILGLFAPESPQA